MVLNSKRQYSRCKIGRLTLEFMEDNNKERHWKDVSYEGEELATDWVETLMKRRREMDKNNMKELGRHERSMKTSNKKRNGGGEVKQESKEKEVCSGGRGLGARKRKRRYNQYTNENKNTRRGSEG